MRIDSHGVEETLALGRLLGRLAQGVPAVTCIGLDGPLGAGKTHLTRGIALGAGVADPQLVSSPTYVLMNIYPGPKPVYHLDAYRVESPEAFAELGLEEMVSGEAGGGVVVVEWAQRIARLLPEDTLWVALAHAGDEERTLELLAGGAGVAKQLLQQVEAAWRGRSR